MTVSRPIRTLPGAARLPKSGREHPLPSNAAVGKPWANNAASGSSINKLRLFATQGTIEAAGSVLERIVENYESPSSALEPRNARIAAHDILRTFAESCRAELTPPATTPKKAFYWTKFSSATTSPSGCLTLWSLGRQPKARLPLACNNGLLMVYSLG